jgi:hypothetical protein
MADFAQLVAAENAPNRGFSAFAARFYPLKSDSGPRRKWPGHGNSDQINADLFATIKV